ncbi:MAG: T9SS type A sorting domain-containing protein [Saprospiraceae bacterium]|nr:T9SS type A sorting domain-containing protein [Saprospiraceae bacterium]
MKNIFVLYLFSSIINLLIGKQVYRIDSIDIELEELKNSRAIIVSPQTEYQADVTLTCPINLTESACQTQGEINTKFEIWKSSASFMTTCASTLISTAAIAPDKCGGSVTVEWTLISECAPDQKCGATFTVTQFPPVVLHCPVGIIKPACLSQEEIDSSFLAWKNSASFTGGCNGTLSNNGSASPNACGGSVSVSFAVSSDCEPIKSCTSSFSVDSSRVQLICPDPVKIDSINDPNLILKFELMIPKVKFSGGCNHEINYEIPNKFPQEGCNDIVFTVTSDCEPDVKCVTSFIIGNVPPVVITCPVNVVEDSCQSQAAIDLKFKDWLNSASVSGGCATELSHTLLPAPNSCGGSTTIMFIASSTSQKNDSCISTFKVKPSSFVTLTCPSNVIEPACQDSMDLYSRFELWKKTASFTGGCNGQLTNMVRKAPGLCGGKALVTFIVSSDCETPVSCTASFTVDKVPVVRLKCPVDIIEPACQSQTEINSKFNDWMKTTSFSGGCKGVQTSTPGNLPDHCGDSVTVLFKVISECESPVSCSSTFKVTEAPELLLKCPNDTGIQTDLVNEVEDLFNKWKQSVTTNGGCNPVITNNSSNLPLYGLNNVIFSVHSDCDTIKTCMAKFNFTTSVIDQDQLTDLHIEILTNPVRDKLDLLINGKYRGRFEINILDLSGRLVQTFREFKQTDEYRFSKYISPLYGGIYFLNCNFKEFRFYKKFAAIQ